MKKKELLFITFTNMEGIEGLGIVKKIRGQIRAFDKKYDTTLVYPNENHLIFEKKEIIVQRIPVNKGLDNYRTSMLSEIKKYTEQHKFVAAYFRNIGVIDWKIYKLIRFLSSKYLFILEIPTYPFNQEIKLHHQSLRRQKKYIEYFLKKIMSISHRLYTKQLKKYVDYIVTFNPIDRIWGIETIVLENGIDTQQIPFNKILKEKAEEIRFIAVGSLQPWHGFDRFIKGLSEYYQQGNLKRIKFTIIGDGVSLSELKELTRKLELSDCVEFLGTLTGAVLDYQYSLSDIAVGSLGLHRIGLEQVSPLKTKEYFAHGLPFIYAYSESQLFDSSPYVFKLSNDDEPIDLKSIIQFYKNITKNTNYSSEIREFTEKYLEWDTQIEKIFDVIDNFSDCSN